MLSSLEKNLVNERKFSGHASSLPRALSVVELMCAQDDWFKEGVVNSIYFDTLNLSAYYEKMNGDNIKMKIRLRWYGEPDDLRDEVPAFLEVKNRLGASRNKVRFNINVPKELLLESDFEGNELSDFLMKYAPKLDTQISTEWRPVCTISYNRRRYFDVPTGSRISVDWNIRSGRFNRLLFPWGRAFSLNSMVVEFKNNGGKPPLWAHEMRLAGLRFGSFSKYGEVMSRLTSGVL